MLDNLDKTYLTDDTITTFYTILTSKELFYISLIIPIIIMACSIESFHKKIKNGTIKNELMREKYSKVLSNSFIKA